MMIAFTIALRSKNIAVAFNYFHKLVYFFLFLSFFFSFNINLILFYDIIMIYDIMIFKVTFKIYRIIVNFNEY